MNSAALSELDGKRVLIEVREYRRMHRIVIARIQKEDDGLYAIFREAYPEHYPAPAKIKIPDKHLTLFIPVLHTEYEYKFQSVLLRGDPQTDDECGWVRPPVIVTQDDINDEKSKTEPNQSLQPTTMLVTDPAAQALRQARSRLI